MIFDLSNYYDGEMEKKRDRKSLVANRRVLDWFENNSFFTLWIFDKFINKSNKVVSNEKNENPPFDIYVAQT